MDLDVAGQAVLRPGTVLDGEAVVWVNGQLSFSAAQARGNSTARRSAALAAEYPANYAVWDCLQVDGVDLRRRPYTERRAALLEVLDGVPPPIQATPASDDADVALAWYEHLSAQGLEGVVAKRATSVYRAGRVWQKLRHAETVDADVVGYVGPATRPHRAAVRLPDGRRVLSRALTAPLSAALARFTAAAGPGQRAHTDDGERYITTEGLVVEVEARHHPARHRLDHPHPLTDDSGGRTESPCPALLLVPGCSPAEADARPPHELQVVQSLRYT